MTPSHREKRHSRARPDRHRSAVAPPGLAGELGIALASSGRHRRQGALHQHGVVGAGDLDVHDLSSPGTVTIVSHSNSIRLSWFREIS